jgi:hypothetical protein
MTLKEKFLELAFAKISSEELRDESVQLADEFAIGFAEWFLNLSKSDDWEKFDYNTNEKLLEIYKKEKGL